MSAPLLEVADICPLHRLRTDEVRADTACGVTATRRGGSRHVKAQARRACNGVYAAGARRAASCRHDLALHSRLRQRCKARLAGCRSMFCTSDCIEASSSVLAPSIQSCA